MTVRIEIPESVASAIRLPGPEVEARLKVELAVALFSEWRLSFGKAAELAGVDRYAFAELVGERGVARHYTERELADDLRYGRGGIAHGRRSGLSRRVMMNVELTDESC